MNDAVFISDLHLHPENEGISNRFTSFIHWAAKNTKSVYILGDFFHVWPGDDAIDVWSMSIAEQLSSLAAKGVALYFMHGNRDFLLGKRFAQLAGLTILKEPTVIKLDKEEVLLVHGDRYCTKDRSHQWLRFVTRNQIFSKFFLLFPFKIRSKLVYKVREQSESNRSKPSSFFEVVPSAMLKHMNQLNAKIIIHGHTHHPGLFNHSSKNLLYRQYVLSDWDDRPHLLCYDKTKGFKFDLFLGEGNG